QYGTAPAKARGRREWRSAQDSGLQRHGAACSSFRTKDTRFETHAYGGFADGATNTHDPEQQQLAHGEDTVQYRQYIAIVEKPNGLDIGHSALPTCFGSTKGCDRCHERTAAQKL